MKIQQFDYSVNILQSLIWQYDESPNLITLLSRKQDWYTINQQQFWTDWYTNVFNLVTANLFGLSVWSYILDMTLFVPLNPDAPDKPLWGFNAYDPTYPTVENTYVNFGLGNFSTYNQNVILTVEEQRFILRLRYFQLVTRGAIPEINKFLHYLTSTSNIVPNGDIWVLDGLDMTITYVFNFEISQGLREVIQTLDLLPRPAGVGVKYVVVPSPVWGFNAYNPTYPTVENTYVNFGLGNFYNPAFS